MAGVIARAVVQTSVYVGSVEMIDVRGAGIVRFAEYIEGIRRAICVGGATCNSYHLGWDSRGPVDRWLGMRLWT